MNVIQNFFSTLMANSLFQVFSIGVLGYFLGRIRIKGIEIGDAGVLIVALIAGHFGAQVPGFVNSFGVATFVAAVGLMAGPKFFHNFVKNIKSYVLIALVIIFSGAAITVLIAAVTSVDSDLAAGLMAGALTSTPGLAAAQEAAETVSGDAGSTAVATGYGIAYPFGVLGVVFFVQLLPKILGVNMDKARNELELSQSSPEKPKKARKLIQVEPLGMMTLFLAVAFGIVLGNIKIPLPGGASFSLGTSGGPLIAGLILGHFGHIGPFELNTNKDILKCMRELGLVLFLIAAGVKGGAGFVEILREHGPMLFVYGALITLVPMILGYLFASKVLKLPILNSLGSICGGMTSTPALGTLIQTSGTDDVATPYASTYPVALVCVVLMAQFIVTLFTF
ncbi:MAG: permease [Lachnospiraceae bacterium]